MSKLDAGRVDITCGDVTYTLEPTLKAMRNISRQFGNFDAALDAVRRRNFDALRYVIVQGASLEGRDAKRVDEHIFRTGLLEVAAPCVDYLAILQNGGRPLGDAAADEDEENAGNLRRSCSSRRRAGWDGRRKWR